MKHLITLYGISNCDSVKRARAWLTERGVAHQFVDFKKHGLERQQLERWMLTIGWDKLLNRQGTTWRKLDATAQVQVVDAVSARILMLAQTSIIKRPVVEWSAREVTVGFDAAAWEQRLKS